MDMADMGCFTERRSNIFLQRPRKEKTIDAIISAVLLIELDNVKIGFNYKRMCWVVSKITKVDLGARRFLPSFPKTPNFNFPP